VVAIFVDEYLHVVFQQIEIDEYMDPRTEDAVLRLYGITGVDQDLALLVFSSFQCKFSDRLV